MATVSNSAWVMNNDGFEDGLKNVFEPRKLADEEFKRGQGIIKDAYAIDEQQALLPTKLAESMVNRRKAEANLQYYEANPNALVDAIGSEYDKSRVVNENLIGKNQAEITARTEQQARDELIASKSFITTPEIKNPDGSVTPATERPTTEIERLELAQTAAPTYKMQQDIGAMVKAKYADVVNQAVAQEDYVGAHEAAKKAGLITGDAKLTRLSDDSYTIQTTYGGTRTIGKKALQQMFVTQAVREKMLAYDNEVAGRIAIETLKGNYDLQGRRITAGSNESVAKTRADAQLGAAQLGYDRSVDTASIRAGGTAQVPQGGGEEAAFSRGGVAAQPTNQTSKSRSKFASTPDEMNIPLSLNKVADETELKIAQFTDAVSKAPNDQELKAKLAREESNLAQISEEMQRMKVQRVRSASQTQQQSPPAEQPSASRPQVSQYAATLIKSLTEKMPPTEQAAFAKSLDTATPEQKRVLLFQGNEPNADQKISEIVNGYAAQRSKIAQPATQAPAMPQSTAPAMQQQVVTEPAKPVAIPTQKDVDLLAKKIEFITNERDAARAASIAGRNTPASVAQLQNILNGLVSNKTSIERAISRNASENSKKELALKMENERKAREASNSAALNAIMAKMDAIK